MKLDQTPIGPLSGLCDNRIVTIDEESTDTMNASNGILESGELRVRRLRDKSTTSVRIISDTYIGLVSEFSCNCKFVTYCKLFHENGIDPVKPVLSGSDKFRWDERSSLVSEVQLRRVGKGPEI